MPATEREYLAALERRVLELERTGNRRASRAGLLLTGLLGVVVLSASMPANGLTAIESRLAVLESLIRPGQDSSLEVKAPFKVLGSSGKVLLNVAERGGGGLVNISTIPNSPGAVLSLVSTPGKEAVSIGISSDGNGRVTTSDSQGRLAAVMSEVGMNVHNTEGKIVAGITRGGGRGRIGIWHNDKWVAELTADEAGHGVVKTYSPSGNTPVVTLGADPQRHSAGALTLMTASGNVIAAMRGNPDGGTGTISVMNSAGKAVAGLTAGSASGGAVVVTNAGGVALAQMSVSDDGRGLFQVFARTGGRPIAVMTQAIEHVGGLLQISNSGNVVANLTVGGQGAGYLQLADPSGTPTVEAGTLADGNGTVRAGPTYQCLPVTLSGPISFVPNCIMGGTRKR
jgi:hypothetical protein